MSGDFLLEKRLKSLNEDYHTRISNTGLMVTFALEKYKNYFPEFTDHTINHSLRVIEFCNLLIGEENVNKLNADEIYVLLMGAYLHDSGMGISEKDYQEFKDKIVSKEYRKENPGITEKEAIRAFHQEFSAGFITKHKILLDIPTDEHVFAIVQISRGHRKNDLYDEKEYPADFKVPNGNTICLPYLSSLIRLADELDIAKDRNSVLQYGDFTDVFKKTHDIISTMEIEDDAFVFEIEGDDPLLYDRAVEGMNKLQRTLDYCVDVCEKRTDFRINQTKVITKKIMKKGE